jgi:hypothetical protein
MTDRHRPAPLGAGRFLFWALLFGGLAGPVSAAKPDLPKLKVANRVVLAPIRADEVVTGAPSVSAGDVSGTLQPQGSALGVVLNPPDVPLSLAPYVLRPMVELWTLKFTPNDGKPLGFVVSYRLTSPTGAEGALGHATQPGATLTATVVARPTRVDVRKNGMMDVAGDAELRIDTSSVAVSGQYVGDLLITVTYL